MTYTETQNNILSFHIFYYISILAMAITNILPTKSHVTHLRFFTLESINMLFKSCHLKIQDIYSIDSCSPGNEQKLDTLINTFKLPSRQQFTTYQYILSAKK